MLDAGGRSSRPARPFGRVHPIILLGVPLVVVAALTQWGVASLPPAARVDRSDAGATAGTPRLAFGSVTAKGAIVFRIAQPVHAWAVDPGGTRRWERDMAEGDYIGCGPCPAAIIRRGDATVSVIGERGDVAAPPPVLATSSIRLSAPLGVVFATRGPGGRVTFLVPTTDGLVESGTSIAARLDQALVAVIPAIGGGAVTILQAAGDALRQGEFELLHVTPAGERSTTVALDPPSARPLPCQVADPDTLAYLMIWGGPGTAGRTRLVVSRGGRGPASDVTVAGVYDSCSVGPKGAVLANSANGEDGDLTRTVVRLLWLSPDGRVDSDAIETVTATSASVALDPATLQAAVAGGTDDLVVRNGSARHRLPPALAVAFDDRGGLWTVAQHGTATRREGSW